MDRILIRSPLGVHRNKWELGKDESTEWYSYWITIHLILLSAVWLLCGPPNEWPINKTRNHFQWLSIGGARGQQSNFSAIVINGGRSCTTVWFWFHGWLNNINFVVRFPLFNSNQSLYSLPLAAVGSGTVNETCSSGKGAFKNYLWRFPFVARLVAIVVVGVRCLYDAHFTPSIVGGRLHRHHRILAWQIHRHSLDSLFRIFVTLRSSSGGWRWKRGEKRGIYKFMSHKRSKKNSKKRGRALVGQRGFKIQLWCLFKFEMTRRIPSNSAVVGRGAIKWPWKRGSPLDDNNFSNLLFIRFCLATNSKSLSPCLAPAHIPWEWVTEL